MIRNMASIYVVTFGEYSNYTIEGIFSKEELAKEFIIKQNYPGYHMEEYELDSPDKGCIKMISWNDKDQKEYTIDEWFNVHIDRKTENCENYE